MKKNLQRIVICFSFFIFWLGSYDAEGQYVTIPDSNFVNWLNANGYAACMNGNLMDTTCSTVVNADTIICTGWIVVDITGITYFDSLKVLICSDNVLSYLPTLPSTLTTLDCHHCSLYSLPSLPNTLTALNCESNYLTTLPTLPNSLTSLSCGYNYQYFTSLPALPNSLKALSCKSDYLYYIPPLPNSMTYLDCHYCGNLDSLPNLPDSLIYLDCSSNNFSTYTLPVLPNTLSYLDCWEANLYSLPLLPNSLLHLDCSNNHLTNLPILPNSLTFLNCGSNYISTVPSFPNSLTFINICYNLISNLPPLPDTLSDLYIFDNPNLFCLPELKKIGYFDFSNTNISCIPNSGQVSFSNPPLTSLPFCNLYNQNSCDFFWNINGKIYNDTNSNCVWDSIEVGCRNLKINLYKNGNHIQQTLSNYEGDYTFDTDTGSFTYSIDSTDLPLSVICPVSQYNSSVITTIDSLDLNMNFGIQCKPGFDVGVNTVVIDSGILTPLNYARFTIKAGDMTNKYGLHCASGISGTVTVIINGPATYISAANGSVSPSVSGDTLLYSIPDFGTVNFNSDFRIIVQTDSTATIDSSFCFEVNVTPTIGEIDSSNNSLLHCFTVFDSFDPNKKEVYPTNRIFIPKDKDKLTYTIRFQNTGNAPAQHIYILDTLEAAIDESSFELLAYSYQPQVQIIGNVVRFNFPNINLPDSVSNEPASHGYVQYRVKLKDSLALGTVISNTSYIYFDFNAPVQTNTVTDTLTDCNNLAAIDVINQTFCAGDTLMLDAALAYPAATDWYVDSVFVSGNQNISIPNLSIGNHEIKLVASNAYCNTEVIRNVSINPLPIVQLGNDSSTCNIPLTLDAGAGNVSYQWSSGETTQTIIANATANYFVIVTDSNGCSNADTVSITINALPAKPTITQNISLLTSSSAAGNQWLMNGNVIPGATNNTYNVTLTGWYSVMVTDGNGCSNLSDSIYMDLTGVSDVSGPNGLIRIVPNPATSSFEVWGFDTSAGSVWQFGVGDVVTVTDVVGKIVYQIKIAQPSTNLKLQTSNYLSGIYFVNIRTNKFSVVLKLIKD